MDEEPSILIEDVYKVSEEGELSKYPLHTEQRYLFLTSDHVFSIVDPSPNVEALYKSAG